MTETPNRCQACRAPVDLNERGELRFDSSQYHMDSVKKLAEIGALRGQVADLEAETKALQQWVDDLQAGMYINCVYCGHRYGPDSEVPASMADVLKEHVERCPKHPMSKLKALNAELLTLARASLRRLTAELQEHYDSNTKSDGEYMDAEDVEIEADIREEIAHHEATIAKAEAMA